MRLEAEAILDFGVYDEQQPTKIVRDYRQEYKVIDEILGRHSDILGMVHGDLAKLSQACSRRGRKADFTSENLFRAILVMQREGFSYREASIRIAESETLQNFCRLLKKGTIDFTLLSKAFGAIRPETWEMINHVLALRADAPVSIQLPGGVRVEVPAENLDAVRAVLGELPRQDATPDRGESSC